MDKGKCCHTYKILVYIRYREEIVPYEGSEALARIATDAVAASSLDVFQTNLDKALSNLVWWKVPLPMRGHCNEILKVPSKPFWDSAPDAPGFAPLEVDAPLDHNLPWSGPPSCPMSVQHLVQQSLAEGPRYTG